MDYPVRTIYPSHREHRYLYNKKGDRVVPILREYEIFEISNAYNLIKLSPEYIYMGIFIATALEVENHDCEDVLHLESPIKPISFPLYMHIAGISAFARLIG